MKKVLSESDKDYINRNIKVKNVEQLSKDTGVKPESIQEYVDGHTQMLQEVVQEHVSKQSGHFVMTSEVSQAADELAKLNKSSRPIDTNRVHSCKKKKTQ